MPPPAGRVSEVRGGEWGCKWYPGRGGGWREEGGGRGRPGSARRGLGSARLGCCNHQSLCYPRGRPGGLSGHTGPLRRVWERDTRITNCPRGQGRLPGSMLPVHGRNKYGKHLPTYLASEQNKSKSPERTERPRDPQRCAQCPRGTAPRRAQRNSRNSAPWGRKAGTGADAVRAGETEPRRPLHGAGPTLTLHRTEKAGRFSGKGEGLAGDVAPRI